MVRKRTLALILTLLFLTAITTIAMASSRGAPVYQGGMGDGMQTMMPTAMMTPGAGMMNGGTGMNANGMATGNCAMMSGSMSMTGMNGMSGMGTTGMQNMQNMPGMTGMSTTGMNGTMMYGMGYNEVILTNPATWLRNPWTLLGWVLLGLVLLAILGGVVFGVVWLVRRGRTSHPMTAV